MQALMREYRILTYIHLHSKGMLTHERTILKCMLPHNDQDILFPNEIVSHILHESQLHDSST